MKTYFRGKHSFGQVKIKSHDLGTIIGKLRKTIQLIFVKQLFFNEKVDHGTH